MNILVFEYLTGGGLLAEDLSPTLVEEGERMLEALLEDLLEISGVELVLLRDARLAPPRRNVPHTIQVRSLAELELAWQTQLARCDAVWPIAPESRGILERLCRAAASAGVILLNSPADAVRLAASKRATVRRLARQGLNVVPTEAIAPGGAPPGFPAVVKPDDGVGGLDARILHDRASWESWLAQADPGGYVMQPFIEGEPWSLSAIFVAGQALLLSCNRQRVSVGESFRFEGCAVNAAKDPPESCRNLADAVAGALPELWGFAGVDFVWTAEGPCVLEINPRLTTAYAGLRRALGVNAAQLVLDLQRTGRLPPFAPTRNRLVEILLGAGHAA